MRYRTSAAVQVTLRDLNDLKNRDYVRREGRVNPMQRGLRLEEVAVTSSTLLIKLPRGGGDLKKYNILLLFPGKYHLTLSPVFLSGRANCN